MRKLSLMFLVIALLAGVSVQAQKKDRTQGPTVRTPQSVLMQDDAGEGFMLFDLATGAYKCKLCEYGTYYSGIGSVKTDGCIVTFSAVEAGYTITAYVDICEQKGKCFIELRSKGGYDTEPYVEILSDSNLRDSQAMCGAYEPPPFDMPSEIILQNDVDGSFLLLMPASGEFKFIHCEDNSAMSGTGRVSRVGPWLNFEVLANEYRVLASVNLESKTSKAVIEVFAPIGEMAPMQEIISDSNFTDNVPACGPKR